MQSLTVQTAETDGNPIDPNGFILNQKSLPQPTYKRKESWIADSFPKLRKNHKKSVHALLLRLYGDLPLSSHLAHLSSRSHSRRRTSCELAAHGEETTTDKK